MGLPVPVTFPLSIAGKEAGNGTNIEAVTCHNSSA